MATIWFENLTRLHWTVHWVVRNITIIKCGIETQIERYIIVDGLTKMSTEKNIDGPKKSVDSRKRQRQPYATIRTAISYLSRLRSAFLSTAFSYSILTLDSTRLDKRLAPSPAARSSDAWLLLHSAIFALELTDGYCKLPGYLNKLGRFLNLPTSRDSHLPRKLTKTDANRKKYQNRLTLKTHTKVKRHQNLSNKR